MAAASTLGGCATGSGAAAPGTSPTTSSPSQGLLTLTTTYRPGHRGAMYAEGALVEVILRDADGEQVGVRTAEPEAPIVFRDLEPGRYVLDAGLRPCDGNCDYLDPRVDTCTRAVDVVGRVEVRVDFVVTAGCRVHLPRTDE